MDLKSLRQQIEQAGFSEEAKKLLLEMVDKTLVKGSPSDDEKKKLLEVIDLEVDRANLEADIREDVAMALEAFVDDVDTATEAAEKEQTGLDKQTAGEVNQVSAQTTS